MSLNANKTNYMVFTTKSVPDNIYVSILNKLIVPGFLVDSKFTWKDHIKVIHNKISKSIGIVCKLKT